MTTTAQKVLVSAFARFVQGDIKGGADAHAFRIETIRNAVEQMFKGNYDPINEAATLTEGKAKKARAYHAGFATFGKVGGEGEGDVRKVAYVGKLTANENKPARERIASLTEHHTAEFFRAFDKVMAEKSEAKPKAAKATEGAGDETAATAGTDATHSAAVTVDSAVQAIIAMLNTGALTGAQLDELGDAVRAAEGRALLAATPEPLAA